MSNFSQIAIQRYAKSTGKPISTPDAVTIINLNDLKIKTFPALPEFVNCAKLYASNSQIEKIEEFTIQRLEDVDFSYNSLQTAPDIAGNYLFTLNLSHNKLVNFTLKKCYPHLIELNLSFQDSDFTLGGDFNELLRFNAPTLKKLYLNKLGLQLLDIVEDLKLSQLELSNNMISDCSELEKLPKTLQVLKLDGNPIVKTSGSFECICSVCRGLIMYNGKEYSEKQVEFSGKKFDRKRK